MSRPNFVFVMADDLGYADLGCYGGRAPVSPNLDRMAQRGVRLTQAYSNSPVCSPTRFALMTGRYQYRLRGAAEEPLGKRMRGNPLIGLPPTHPTMPSLLRAAGYRTALIGKWHLGYPPYFGPLKSGYDEFFGSLGGGLDYFTHLDNAGEHDLFEGDIPAQAQGYLTDLITERAVQFIERQTQTRTNGQDPQPFLLSVHYTAPHWPWETRDDRPEATRIAETLRQPDRRGVQLSHVDGGSLETYQKMIHHMDEGIGAIVTALEKQQLDRQTIVVFTSDNGAERFSDTWPLIGQKMDLLEGGIRVPVIVYAPGHVRAGEVSHQTAMSMDWLPTFLDWAGVAADPAYPPDGVSLRPYLESSDRVDPRRLYWRMKYRDQHALRDGDWKYLRINGEEYLFNLTREPRECVNLAGRSPARLAALRSDYEQWQAGMPPVPADALSMLAYSKRELP